MNGKLLMSEYYVLTTLFFNLHKISRLQYTKFKMKNEKVLKLFFNYFV